MHSLFTFQPAITQPITLTHLEGGYEDDERFARQLTGFQVEDGKTCVKPERPAEYRHGLLGYIAPANIDGL